MRSFASRRGSALLVVLGMLAFMVVSAVAFSAYMRRARLPSNYLRRATSSRELVKAALARAIDDIDHAVNDNPHPGLGTKVCKQYDENTKTINTNRNGWVGRVFMNTDMSNNSTTKDNAPSGAADPNDTVSVLSLEGLAYVPAPLQGEARYYSRRTPTAEWHSFDFDAGRYAYFALDVSDYFDVNRMFANEPRSSAANTRITLSYLLENGNGGTWDSFLKSGTPAVRSVDDDLNISFSGSCVPLTSVADMNLLLGSSSCGPFKSWFYEYYNKGKGSLEVGSKPNDDENPRLMPLITDACFITNDVFKTTEAYSKTWDGNGLPRDGDPYDLSSGNSQPFNFVYEGWQKDSPFSLGHLASATVYDNNIWLDYLSYVGFAALCDYLDYDHIPTSLAIPTVERVPMICGFKVPSGTSGKVSVVSDPEVLTYKNEAEETRTAVATVKYHINMDELLGNLNAIQAMGVFPFIHDDDKDGTSWKVDGRVSLFFSSEEMRLRTGNAQDPFHIDELDSQSIPASNLDVNNGILAMKMDDTGVSFNASRSRASFASAFNENIGLTINGASTLASQIKAADFITVVYEWEQKKGSASTWATPAWSPSFEQVKDNMGLATSVKATMGMSIPNRNGGAAVAKGKEVDLKNGKWFDFTNLRLNAAVWMRVRDSDDFVVDMVPACVYDDKIENFRMKGVGKFADVFESELGASYPLMLLGTAAKNSNGAMAEFPISSLGDLDKLSSGVNVELTENAFFAPDPRYNYAPEDWVQQSGALSSSAWRDVNKGAFGVGSTDLQGEDIYFATSDAGYLQSLYELSNMPYVTNLRTGNTGFRGDRMLVPSGGTAIPTSVSSTCHNNLFWQNYDPMFNTPINVESNLLFHTSYQGQRVNPYSDNMEVVRAVFANTPLDWKRASTNTTDTSGSYGISKCAGNYNNNKNGGASEFNKNYTWSDNSPESNAKLNREELEDFAEEFIKQVRQNYSSKTWDVILRELMNDSSPNELGGVSLSSAKLYKSDRDFLYGYWRDCFAARQQLYLIFVRAEPLMLGGSSPGATPPQLGGRAVALVWRDPTAVGDKGSTDCPGYPHPTRVLFYKNLE